MLNIKKIKKAMSEGKITKAKLCSTTGIARTTFDAILNGSDAKISTIEAISRVLKVKIGFLFDEEIEVRSAGRDYVEDGKIEHKGTEYNAPVTIASDKERELEKENADLRQQLIDAQKKIINLMEERK
ncbi:helix-turn-helix transcriptional regulator [uncultured Duncaniella sp.]|uniref:helix-turn-helix domain-containing protein n=1 Tax=uncultured Duncaniella sp. TaxID=2768039 RepID=UPI0025AF11DC|nr:helix-turn-helix transcriptional regulator [uncultured Duncaniella sp.]